MRCSFKICNNCDAENRTRVLRCRRCGERPIFRLPAIAEIEAYTARQNAKRETLIAFECETFERAA
jgi:hypothetical protein